MLKTYTKEELGNLNSTQRDGTINAEKTFVVIAGNTYLLADLLTVKKEKVVKEKLLGAVKKEKVVKAVIAKNK